jgi:hypothetical protein
MSSGLVVSQRPSFRHQASREDPSVKLPASRVRTLLCEDVEAQLTVLEGHVEAESKDERTAVVVLSTLPPLEALLDNVLNSLAEIALALWPYWYCSVTGVSGFKAPPNLPQSTGTDGSPPPALGWWFDAAAKLCAAGTPPLLKGVPRATQTAQLALAIQPDRLVIGLALTGAETSESRLLGLAKAAEWVLRTAQIGCDRNA